MAIGNEGGLWRATDRVSVKAYDARLERTHFNRSPSTTMTQNTIAAAPRLAFMPVVPPGACVARQAEPAHLASAPLDGD